MSTISANIQKYSISSSSSSFYSFSFVNYFIQILFHGRQWFIKKRYSDFYNFHLKISKYYKNLPNLPSKTYQYWNKFSNQIIIKRLKKLNLYLNEILKIVSSDNNLLKEFLEVDSNFLLYNINSLKFSNINVINSIDFEQNILKLFIKKVLNMNIKWRLENCNKNVFYKKNITKLKKKKKNFLMSINLKSDLSSPKTTSITSKNSSSFSPPSSPLINSNNNKIVMIENNNDEILRDSFRESYLSTNSQGNTWRDANGDDNEDENDEENENDLDSLPSITTIATSSSTTPNMIQKLQQYNFNGEFNVI